MPETISYTQPHDPDMLNRLAERLDPSRWMLTASPADAETSIVINGYLSAEELACAPNLRALIIPFAGVPPRTRDLMLDFPQISVHNLHHNAPETAELAMALLLACSKRLIPMDRALRKGDWSPRYDSTQAIRLDGRTAVIVGFGEVGHRIGLACLGLGMRVIGHRSRLSPSQDGVEMRGPTDLKTSLREADVLVLALPHTSQTSGMIGPAELALLKPGAILINIARAGLVDEEALYFALKEGRLRAAGLDVWYRYPESDAAKGYMGYAAISDSARSTPPSTFPFHELDNVVMSPHRGGTSADVEAARVKALADLLNAPEIGNRVDLSRGY
ncbi:MAG: NAD(P)-dependent oxidoreductase [Fimbriimonadaceae bacterium]